MKLNKLFFLCLLAFATLSLPSCQTDDDTVVNPGGGNGSGSDTPPEVSILDLSVQEGDTEKNIFVRIQLSKSSDVQNTVYISSNDGTAVGGEDFLAFTEAEVVFPAGDLIKDYQIRVLGDTESELNENFEVVITRVDGDAEIDKGVSEVSILNDDGGNSLFDIPETGYSTPESYPNLDLIWQDEFSGSNVDGNSWTFEMGNGNSGWGNNELQFYTDDNASVVDGYLVIEARLEDSGQYTSSRMITKDKFDFQFGRVDIRAALPEGQGVWPALWMLGDRISTVGWPSCGEIDIMEIVGHQPNNCHGTAHWSNSGGNHTFNGDSRLSPTDLGDQFHVFSIIWSDGQIRWLLNDVEYHVLNTQASEMSEFNIGDFFFIFNVAVGGNWPGYPDDTTVFPQRMFVDYIRVFQ